MHKTLDLQSQTDVFNAPQVKLRNVTSRILGKSVINKPSERILFNNDDSQESMKRLPSIKKQGRNPSETH